MSDVEITITAIQDQADGTYLATMNIGDKRVTAELERRTLDGGVVGFAFCGETVFSLVLYYCGLDRRFNNDFGRYVQGHHCLPWDYGEVMKAKVDRAFARVQARLQQKGHDH